jgi:hypothetical protein
MKWVPKSLSIDNKKTDFSHDDQANEETKETKPQKLPSL